MELPRVKMGRRHNKRFNYVPRYYDEDKEDLENRKEKIKAEVTGKYSYEGSRRRLQAGFRNGQRESVDPSMQQLKLVSRIRVLLIVIVLASLAYMVFYTNTISTIFEAFKHG